MQYIINRGKGIDMNIEVLWAKKSNNGAYWLPLTIHFQDTAEVAKKLWNKWVPHNVKRIIIESIGGSEEDAIRLFVFLAAGHDLGKATPVFQSARTKSNTGLDADIYNRLLTNGFDVRETRNEYRNYHQTPHALASQLLFEQAKTLKISDNNLNKKAAFVIGAHHGKPPDRGYGEKLDFTPNFGHDLETNSENWLYAQSEIIKQILTISEYESLDMVQAPAYLGQVLLSGLVIIADWIASNERFFPLMHIDFDTETDSVSRTEEAWSKLDLPSRWEPHETLNSDVLYNIRFEIEKPYVIQKDARHLATMINHPGIMIIEAPMGRGKTEAALAVAEIFRDKTDSGGIFFALPTQATSNGIFPRIQNWISKLNLMEPLSVRLAHGKAQHNKDYKKLLPFSSSNDKVSDYDDVENGEDNAGFAHEWFNGRKTAILADFVVGTIDQLLMMALKQKHVMLRHIGLASKVVIIDECHAYDAYMNHYLKMALTWLGAYGVPVIILSATLPIDVRGELIKAYLGKNSIAWEGQSSLEYPIITYTDGKDEKTVVSQPVKSDTHQSKVKIERLEFDEITDKLKDMLSEGGCAGVIMDTVNRAQIAAKALREHFGEDAVILVHSRFIIPHRLEKEEIIRKKLGKDNKERPKTLIIVGTQVLEQSLDIDFDVMITDIAPMDLVLQRIGRLHRHRENDECRSEKLKTPICYITGIEGDDFDQGIEYVYDRHLLIRTRDILESLDGVIILPGDISSLVNTAYDKAAPETEEKMKWEHSISEMVGKANAYRMGKPMNSSNSTIRDWLNVYVDDAKGEASVRDSYDTIEVLVVKRIDNRYFMVNGENIPLEELDGERARELAKQSVSLPRELSTTKAIDELRDSTNDVAIWQTSSWITGELFLILDESGSAELSGRKVTYSYEDGLSVEKEDEKNLSITCENVTPYLR